MCHRAGLRKKIELSKTRKVPEWCRNKMMLVLPGKGGTDDMDYKLSFSTSS